MNPIIFSLYFFTSMETEVLIKRLEDLIDFRVRDDESKDYLLERLENLMKKIEKYEEISKILKNIKENEDVIYIEEYVSQNIKY